MFFTIRIIQAQLHKTTPPFPLSEDSVGCYGRALTKRTFTAPQHLPQLQTYESSIRKIIQNTHYCSQWHSEIFSTVDFFSIIRAPNTWSIHVHRDLEEYFSKTGCPTFFGLQMRRCPVCLNGVQCEKYTSTPPHKNNRKHKTNSDWRKPLHISQSQNSDTRISRKMNVEISQS